MTSSQLDAHPGDRLHGFCLKRSEPLPNLRAHAYMFEHEASGARLLHISTDDTENAFAVTFPTPPPDDTGLPHILEHAVLGGSEKYPVREPFFEMAKMSMATFINAMTSQAYTVYPVASNVHQDFFNLADVYMDAVFHPELSEATFRREGHHLTLEDNADVDSPLDISGIVYSEMKGAYSTPESLMWVHAGRGLFPDTPLGRDSGGDPDHIPELTYEQFLEFHRTRYHPSNALIFIYGDIPTTAHLEFVNARLDGFSRHGSYIDVPRQDRWSSPREIVHEYPIGETEEESGRTFITLNWLVGDALDPDTFVLWSVLQQILLGNEAALLKKAIIDSKLGDDLFFSGSFSHAYECTFHVGIKGSEPERADAFRDLVLDTLAEIAHSDLETWRIDAAFQQLAYSNLEVTTLFPLSVLHQANTSWPYGSDPLTFLRIDEHLECARQRCADDPQMLNRLIREGLLDNPHRLRVVLRPDRGMQVRRDQAFAAAMAARKAELSPAAVAAVAATAAELEAMQGVENTPEALAKLPQLQVSDLPETPRVIPTEVREESGITVLHNDVFANGVNYLNVDVDLTGLPDELVASLPRFVDAVSKMGAAGQSYTEIAQRRAACTGGLGVSVQLSRHATDVERSLPRLRFWFKTLDSEAARALQLFEDVVFGVDPRDAGRLRDVVTQARARQRTRLINDGLGTARRRASRCFGPEASLDEVMSGCGMLRTLEDLTSHFDDRVDDLVTDIEAIRAFVCNRSRWTMSFTGSKSVYSELARRLADWSGRLDAGPAPGHAVRFSPCPPPPREGLAAPMEIAHCTKVMPGPHLGHPDLPLLKLGVYLTSFDYCLPEIRFKGNAYGGGMSLNDALCTCSLYSFRDPRLVETLEVFDHVRDFVHTRTWSQADVDRGIIGSAKGIERPIRPGEATGLALTRYLRGDTDALREQRYRQVLSATPGQVKAMLLGFLEENEPKASVCVVSSLPRLTAANEELGSGKLVLSNILP